MTVTGNETQLQAIALKLADLKVLQTLLISNEEKLMSACSHDSEIRSRLESMIKDDRDNLGTIDKAAIQLGIEASPQEKTTHLVESINQIMSGDELDLYEKALEHEGLKHLCVMTGLLIHKAAQTVGDELEKTIDPINKVNFKNRAHQEQLKGVVQVLGTRQLIGKEPDNSIWTQAEDAIAALKGMFGGLSD